MAEQVMWGGGRGEKKMKGGKEKHLKIECSVNRK